MELKPIDRTDRGIGRLNAALTIYQKTILPEAQNPVRQILYWIEHSKNELLTMTWPWVRDQRSDIPIELASKFTQLQFARALPFHRI